jgi:hypothetical protein
MADGAIVHEHVLAFAGVSGLRRYGCASRHQQAGCCDACENPSHGNSLCLLLPMTGAVTAKQ